MYCCRYLVSCILLISVTACQKSVDWTAIPSTGTTPGTTPGTGGTGTGSGLLVKMVHKELTDSTTFTYAYDSNKKLIYHNLKLEGPLYSGDFRKHIRWDSQGRISTMIDSTLQSSVVSDTTATTFYYSGTTNIALYAIAVSSPSDKDSIVFTYSGSQIIKLKHYAYSAGTGMYAPDTEHLYTYDTQGNIATVKSYNLTGITPALIAQSTVTYDTKVSAFGLGANVLLMYSAGSIEGGAGVVGPNNAITETETDSAPGGKTGVTTYTYSYLGNNKPSNGVSNFVPAGSPIGIPSSFVFYYQ